jgi:hypothetical protein
MREECCSPECKLKDLQVFLRLLTKWRMLHKYQEHEYLRIITSKNTFVYYIFNSCSALPFSSAAHVKLFNRALNSKNNGTIFNAVGHQGSLRYLQIKISLPCCFVYFMFQGGVNFVMQCSEFIQLCKHHTYMINLVLYRLINMLWIGSSSKNREE